MATYVEINGSKYPASITGRLSDKDWNNRESKAIRLEMTYVDVIATFVDDISWNIVQENEMQHEIMDVEGNISFETEIETEVYDNSDYCIAGDVVDHRDGTVTVKMGKPTAEEIVAVLDAALLDATYQNITGGLE